ncbi:MAG TPA: hypothetical protein VF669_18315 [Tepidisphaeraceae bacterium]|jgi:hypothetical protein
MTRYENYPTQADYGANCSRDTMDMIVTGIGGLALGAALMYVFDPNKGDERRSYLGEIAGSAWDTTASTLSSLASGVGSAASGVGEYVSDLNDRSRDAREEYSGRLGSTYKGLRKAVGGYLDDWSDSAHSGYKSAAKSTRKLAKNLPSMPRVRITREEEEDEGFSGTSLAASAFSALALGCAAMYFFDARLGRSRRAYVMQKAGKFVRDTGDLARSTGRHLANKSRGYYHEASNLMPGQSSQATGSSAPASENANLTGSMGSANLTNSPSQPQPDLRAYDLQSNTRNTTGPNPTAL